MKVKSIILFAAFFLLINHLNAQTVFTYRSPESENDSRYDYDNALLKLALEKTIDSHGEYILKASPVMNYARMQKSLIAGTFENPMFKQSATNNFAELLDYANFPVDLGIVGFRVFFVSPEIMFEIENVITLDDLKNYSIIQGFGWTDIEILRSAGFNVIEVPQYESLFLMITSNRADLLARGVNEVKGEMENHRELSNLRINKKVVLYYPLPRFFFTSKGNLAAANRVRDGLLEAYEDGSLIDLWNKYYQDSIEYTDLKNRIIISIPNPLISNIDKSYEKYLYINRN